MMDLRSISYQDLPLLLLLLFTVQSLAQLQAVCRSKCRRDADCGLLKCINRRCDDDQNGSKNVSMESRPKDCDQFCCEVHRNYSAYYCSPTSEHRSSALMIAITRDLYKGLCGDLFNASAHQVAMSTGWFQNGESCGKSIRIFGANGTSLTATVIDVCDSTKGCSQDMDYHKPCANNILSATNSIWKAFGVIKNVTDGATMNVTWEFVKSGQRSDVGKIAGTASAAAIFVVSCLICVWIKCRRRIRERRNNEKLTNSVQALPGKFDFTELEIATKHFSNKLGSGGFGSVYLGVLADGTEVAVKRMENANKVEKQFAAEVMSVGSIHHVNLVRLRGFCVHLPWYILVYEYMSNSSLDKWLFVEKNKKVLDWKKRFTIALDVATGLSYLHNGCRDQVLHLDLKPQNILLDENFRPKIADFGLSKLVARKLNESSSFTETEIRGTPGYMAPEWLISRVTDKTDVYSFGVVLLELVSGKKPYEIPESANSEISLRTLTEFVERKVREGEAMDVVDHSLVGDASFVYEEAVRVLEVGLWCSQPEPGLRPAIADALKMLQGSTYLMVPPEQSGLP